MAICLSTYASECISILLLAMRNVLHLDLGTSFGDNAIGLGIAQTVSRLETVCLPSLLA